MKKSRLLLRLIVSPLMLLLLVTTFLYYAIYRWTLFIRYGGEWIAYENLREPITIKDIYDQLKENQ